MSPLSTNEPLSSLAGPPGEWSWAAMKYHNLSLVGASPASSSPCSAGALPWRG